MGSTLPMARTVSGTFFCRTVATLTGTPGSCALPRRLHRLVAAPDGEDRLLLDALGARLGGLGLLLGLGRVVAVAKAGEERPAQRQGGAVAVARRVARLDEGQLRGIAGEEDLRQAAGLNRRSVAPRRLRLGAGALP